MSRLRLQDQTVLCWRTAWPCRWRHYTPSKRW